MREEYDFSKAKPNPYAKKLKAQITINLNIEVIDYFKKLSAETGITYQNLINLYLMSCVKEQKKISFDWR